jgi:uncharacterized protein (DUF1330 family)
MPAYLIAEQEITDPETFEKYREISSRTIAQHGGRFIVRGGAVEPLEGGWVPKRLVIVEFPTMEQARRWYSSAEYAPGIKLRQAASTGRSILVEGLSSD